MGNYKMNFKNYLNESKITLYHGDNYGTHFISPKKMAQGNMQEGPGIYFSPDIKVARIYGSKIVSIEADPKTFLNSRKMVKQERSLNNNLYYILKDLWKSDNEAMFYLVSDYIFVQEPEDVNLSILREFKPYLETEEVRNLFITLSDSFGIDKFQKAFEKHLPRKTGTYNPDLQFYAVIKQVKINKVEGF